MVDHLSRSKFINPHGFARSAPETKHGQTAGRPEVRDDAITFVGKGIKRLGNLNSCDRKSALSAELLNNSSISKY